MNRMTMAMAMAMRAALCGALAVGVATTTACSSDHAGSEARNVGTVTIPLLTTVGANTYRLDATFVISGAQGTTTTLVTKADEPALVTTLPAGSYSAFLQSFTLSKDDGTGTFHPVSATVVSTSQAFSIAADATTTISFQFQTDGVVVPLGSGNVSITFGVTETPAACDPISVDPGARTARSTRFFLDFSNTVAGNPEDLDVLQWAGGPNLLRSFALDACTSSSVEHFGNSWAPPDPDRGGLVLVGSGSGGGWVQDGASIVIHSTSSGCAQSLAVPVETTYRFREGIAADTIEIERQFDLGSTPLGRPFRPFIPRLTHAFDRVLHPDATGTTLLSETVLACPYGCQLSNWDGSWFAYYASSGSLAGQGMIVRRAASALPASLWIDDDGGATDTNASSVLLSPPDGGFPPQVSEKELLCFFDAESWSPALTLPPGCTLGLECNGGPSPCEPNPCQHGGTCSEVSGDYTCACPPGINGKNCDLVFTKIEAGLNVTCGIRSDGHMVCWGDNPYAGQWSPTDTFETLSLSASKLAAVHTGGAAQFWGNEGEPVSQPPALLFSSVAATGDDAGCGIVNNGSISCWGNYSIGYDPPPIGTFQAVSMGNWHICALRTDRTLTCWGLRGGIPASLDFGQAIAPAGTFLAVRSGETASCGLRTDGTVACWGASAGRAISTPSGTFIALDYRSDFGCGIRTDHTLACWGTGSFGETIPPFGTYRSIATGYYHPCAVSTDDSVVCWGAFAGPESEQPPAGQP